MAILMPRAGGCYLSRFEVIKRVTAAFAFAETTEEDARRHVLEWMNQLMFVASDGRAAADDDFLAQLERHQDDARFVHFGDDLGGEGTLLSMLVIPDQPLMIEHAMQLPQEAVDALVARCAAALDYVVAGAGGAEDEVRPDASYPGPYAAAA
ncbi:MAG: hypothetical protein HY322_00355 [Betaproteobacteria bacterium]|nr:hypothetical protein [Betaproteobacteria bacterium]